MISSVVVFVLAFAAMGLLLGFAATMDVRMERPPAFQLGPDMNNTSSNVDIQEQVNVTVQKAPGS
ncbi:MAG: hypothetical protein ABI347_01275 [Nitrososphaera sp.]|jgi:hypothetical protein